MNIEEICYSVVIPVKNEEENIEDLILELEPVMQTLQKSWELLFINDGSHDNTLNILKQQQEKRNYIKILSFKKNYGQSSAFDAGYKAARGEFVITLDGDRQNDPADIPKLLSHISDYDLICGWRINRKDTVFKRLISRYANRIRNWFCQDGMHDTGCSLKIYRTVCLKKIKMYHGMHRFLPALFKIEGFRVKEIPVNHRPRLKGKSNYNIFNRSFNTVFDLFAVNWMKKRQLKYQFVRESDE